MRKTPHAAIWLATLALTLCACGGGGSGSDGDGVERLPRHAYTGPTDRGAEAGTPPDPDAPSDPDAAVLRVTSAADSGVGSLRAAIDHARTGDLIVIDAALAGAVVALESQLQIPQGRHLVIAAGDAPGFCLDGRDRHRILDIRRETTVELIGLCFRRGRAIDPGTDTREQGGAIQAGDHGFLHLRHCRFVDNQAERGGAVRVGYGTELTVEDCTFLRNDGASADDGWSGGGIATFGHGDLIVRRCWFEDNHGSRGGAIYNLLGPITVEDCTFLFNRSRGGGGAVFTDEGNWTGPGATVGGHIRIRRCWIQDNHAYGVGGGLFLWANPLDEVLVEDCVLAWNRVDRGGGNDAKGGGLRTLGQLTVSRCAFVGNVAEQQGGGAWIDGQGPIAIRDTTFSANQVVDDAGGGINLNLASGASAELVHCSFVGNRAGRACGAFWLPRKANGVTVANTLLAANTATSEAHIGYPPEHDGGGNLQWPGSGGNLAATRTVADPLLGALVQDGAMLIHPLDPASPAIGLGDPSAATASDARGLARDGEPDCGAVEAPPGGDG